MVPVSPGQRVGVILFHVGLLAVLGGHVGGLLVPKDLTETAGVTEDMYHGVAVVMGTFAGVTLTAGVFILALRRFGNDRVRATSRTSDRVVIGVLILVVVTGMINTIGVQILGIDACRRGWAGIELRDGRFATQTPTPLSRC